MRVITFSRHFPKGHPKAGQETHFVEKMWLALIDQGLISMSKAVELSRQTGIGNLDMNNIRKVEQTLKFHTIRAGNRWKVGDMYSPRVWSGKPYASKQIEFAPPIRIEKIWEFGISEHDYFIKTDGVIKSISYKLLKEIALNDGLELDDFESWFATHPKKNETLFTGQILCHNPEINY
jgi:hypothetical protein